MIEKPVNDMEITSTSLDLLSQAASLLNGGQHVKMSDYGTSIVSSSPTKELQMKGQKLRCKKSARREALSTSSSVKIRPKKTQLSTSGDWEMNTDNYEIAKSSFINPVDQHQSVPPPPYPSSPSPPRNPVLPPYPSSYRGDPLEFPQITSYGLPKVLLKDCSNNDCNNNYNTPLDMSKKSLESDAASKQHRPSVITCASSLQQLQQCHHQEELRDSSMDNDKDTDKDQLPQGHRREILSGMCDPVIDEHFRRSLGKDYSEIFSTSTSHSVSVTVDDHFAKALGDTWLRLQQSKPVKENSSPSNGSSRQPVVQHAPSIITL